MSAYGFMPIPHTEDGPINSPNPYVATKLFGEQLMKLYFQNHGLETISLRFSSVYGIGEHTKGRVANPVTQFIWSALIGKPPKVFGDGNQTRDLVYVDDVCTALMSAAFNGVSGEVYNVSTNIETSMNSLVDVLRKVHDDKIEPFYTEWKPYDQQSKYIDRQCASFDKLNQTTGWKPTVKLEDGVKTTYDYYKSNREIIPPF
jgi:nucleoside-diphosphate-sugar epimerase